MLRSRFETLPQSPFVRLARDIAGIEPGRDPVDMAVGEPGHPLPAFVKSVLAAENAGFSRYPPGPGTPELRQAIARWLTARYRLKTPLDGHDHVLAVSGSREALFAIALVAVPEAAPGAPRPAVLMPNPFYQCYAAGALGAGAEPVALDATRETGFLPDFDAIPDALMGRAALIYLCSPANPQGAVTKLETLKTLIARARAHKVVIVADECYSEIYSTTPPPGLLEAADEIGDGWGGLMVFNSLSKRSSLPGLRLGFCAGDADLIARFSHFRNVAGPQVPLPVQAVGIAAWGDEAHVQESRALYAAKMDAADAILAGRLGHYRPDGGFFLWLDVGSHGGGRAATGKLWAEAGIRVLPGEYLASAQNGNDNPGRDYIRVALVHDLETTKLALKRMAATLA